MRYDIDFLFCVIDDFCKMYEMWEQHRLIPLSGSRRRSGMMSLSELMTIMVLFHVSPSKVTRWFYRPFSGRGMAKSTAIPIDIARTLSCPATRS